ncbi:MAG TPA: alpha/beta hydrolase [Stellaceae bacterium]|nr:alpha/beta hydrolase [Stellaceae bacterium]
MLEETFVELRGAKLNLRRGGKGAPVLFLHGAQGYAGSDPAMDALAQDFTVLAPDHPGFGHSDAFDWIDDVPDLAFLYLDLLAMLGLEDVHVVGHGLGGWTALEMAIRSTARIKSLILAAAAGIRVPGVPRADMFICTPEELARLIFAGDGWQAWNASLTATPELQEIADRNRFQAAKLCWQPRLFNPKLEKWLHRIDRPTRILWGEDDRIIPPAYGARLKELIAGAGLVMLPRTGHLMPVEQPQRFAAEIRRFIREDAA